MAPGIVPSSLTGLISVAVAPVVLISAAAILLSGYSGKYSSIADRLRSLAAEYRRSETSTARRETLRRQIVLFHRRATAVWLASALLSVAVVAFVMTVLSVIVATQAARVGMFGAGTLVVGLMLVGSAVLTDLYEIRLARLTIAGEIADIFQNSPEEG